MSDHTYTPESEHTATASDADTLYTAFMEDPAQTWLDVTAELFGSEAANKAVSSVYTNPGEKYDDVAPDSTSALWYGDGGQEALAPHDAYDSLSAADREALDYAASLKGRDEQDAISADYNDALDEHLNGTGLDPNALHPFVAMAAGDIGHAIDLYREWASKTGNGQPDPALLSTFIEAAEGDVPAALEAYGRWQDDHGSPAVPAAQRSSETTPKGYTLDNAMDDLLSDVRAHKAAPAAIGSYGSSLSSAVDELAAGMGRR
jgi:hypothetical protein